jgi:hypothetical protein
MSPLALLGMIVALLALLYVVAPLLRPALFRSRDADASDGAAGGVGESRPLEGLRDELLARIVELDFDREVGKVDEEEWREERADLKRQVLAVLRLLDERAVAAAQSLPDPAIEDEIEREVRAARSRREVPPLPAPAILAGTTAEDEVEREIVALRRARRERAAPPAGDRAR